MFDEPTVDVFFALSQPTQDFNWDLAAQAITRRIRWFGICVGLRDVLAARGLTEEPAKLDKRIAALRAQRARAEIARSPAAALEISASRAAPQEQRMRMIFGVDGPPP